MVSESGLKVATMLLLLVLLLVQSPSLLRLRQDSEPLPNSRCSVTSNGTGAQKSAALLPRRDTCTPVCGAATGRRDGGAEMKAAAEARARRRTEKAG